MSSWMFLLGTEANCFAHIVHEENRRAFSFNPLKFMEATTSRHRRSVSDPAEIRSKEDALNNTAEASTYLKLDMGQLKKSAVPKKRQSFNTEVQNSLKQEILQLQKGLLDQVVARCALEKALGHSSSPCETATVNSMPKAAEDLIKEIAILELEVKHLEKYLLSMYRKQFDRQVSSLSSIDEKLKSGSARHKGVLLEDSGHDTTSKKENSVIHSGHPLTPLNSIDKPPKECNDTWGAQKVLDSGIHRSHSSISQHSISSLRASPPMGILAEAVNSYHSLPLSMLERAENATSNTMSLAEHFSTHISNGIPETPNQLSEEMIKCISAIYCKLAEPPLVSHDFHSSPISFSSSMGEFSPRGQCDMWSSPCRKDSSFDPHLVNPPFHNEGSQEFSGPYCTMVEVQWICTDSKKLRDVEHMLKRFRSLISGLEEVDPRKMKNVEKLAFWINVHNALAMHAFLVNGIPKNNLKRISLLLKAAYNVGGHTTSIDMIQSSILGCRLPRPGLWLRFFLSPKMKFKVGYGRKAYAIEQPEPLLHFALCSGSHSDPAVRVYTPKRIFLELELAKEEYIQTTFCIRKEQKVLMPKLVESFAKDLDLCPIGLLKMIEHFMPASLMKSIQQCRRGKFSKSIEWIPHKFAFRYLLSNELAQLHL
ncbi:uncharacterized protein LOC131155841 [Malania oleifera]|uniref:uncharacterized protein LOC131155841 n=1 Tax=Malania oleifera TaxID=397392 RepID=UPI0025AE86DA|nr:uncharacterized protein LOC131155841 [Malania oleifera]